MRRRFAAVGRLLLAVAAIALPPLLLARLVGWPLPRGGVDVDAAVDAVAVGAIPATFYVNLLAAVAWVVWAVLVGLLAIELVAVVRNRPSASWTPLVVRRWAQSIVTAVVMVSGSNPQLALAATAPSVPVPVTVATATATETVHEPGLHRVAEADSWSGWAERTFGDAELGAAVRAANVGRDVGGHTLDGTEAWVEAGWRLRIPDATPAPSADAAADVDHVVAPGDTLWQIAEDHLGDGAAWPEVWQANAGETMADGRIFDDPDLIHPGWALDVDGPTTETAPPAERQVPPAEPSADVPAAETPAPPAADTHAPATPAPERPDVSVDGDAGDVSDGSDVEDARQNEPVVSVGDLDADADAVVDVDATTAWGTPTWLAAGGAASMLASAGVLALLRRRRRRAMARRGQGLRLPTTAPEVAAAVGRHESAEPDPDALGELGRLLRTLPSELCPEVVWWTDDGTVTVVGGNPSYPPVAPWQATPDGSVATWRTSLGMPGEERSLGLPLLVTVGRTEDGRTVAVDVGQVGRLSIVGPSHLITDRLRAMALEVATSRLSGPVEVVTITGDRLAACDRVREVDDLREAVADSVAEGDAGLLADDRTPRLLVAADRSVLAPRLPDSVRGLVGTLAAGGPFGWQLRVDSSSSGALVLPDGALLSLTLPDLDADVVLDELDRLEQVAPLDTVHDLADDDLADDDLADTTTDVAVAPADTTGAEAHHCEVRVLGPVDVVLGGATVHLAPKTLDVLTYLAIHRDGVSVERLDEAVWAGAAGTETQRVRSQLTKLRRALGDGPDGESLLPARTQDDTRIVLSEHVGTDLDRAMQAVQRGRHVDDDTRRRLARGALELVRGRPFETLDLPEWAAETDHVAVARLQDEALWLAADARGRGALDDARWAVERGLDLFELAEQLWAEWLRIASAAGDRDEVRRVMNRARAVLAVEADETTGTAIGPSPDLESLYGELLSA